MRPVVVVAILLAASPVSAEIRPGDVVFQSSNSAQGRVIREVTRSQWSHVGVVFSRDGELQVLEAVTVDASARSRPMSSTRCGVRASSIVRSSCSSSSSAPSVSAWWSLNAGGSSTSVPVAALYARWHGGC